MIQETLSICQFRLQLTRYCRAVKLSKKELVVTYNGSPLFKVVKLSGNDNYLKSSLTNTRDHMSDFVDLIEGQEKIILTAHHKPLVKCELIK